MQLMQCQLPRHSLSLVAAVLANIICSPLHSLCAQSLQSTHWTQTSRLLLLENGSPQIRQCHSSYSSLLRSLRNLFACTVIVICYFLGIGRFPFGFPPPLPCRLDISHFFVSAFVYGDDDTQAADSCFVDLLRADNVFNNEEMFLIRSRMTIVAGVEATHPTVDREAAVSSAGSSCVIIRRRTSTWRFIG